MIFLFLLMLLSRRLIMLKIQPPMTLLTNCSTTLKRRKLTRLTNCLKMLTRRRQILLTSFWIYPTNHNPFTAAYSALRTYRKTSLPTPLTNQASSPPSLSRIWTWRLQSWRNWKPTEKLESRKPQFEKSQGIERMYSVKLWKSRLCLRRTVTSFLLSTSHLPAKYLPWPCYP